MISNHLRFYSVSLPSIGSVISEAKRKADELETLDHDSPAGESKFSSGALSYGNCLRIFIDFQKLQN
jgi:hypothetical protein